MVKKAALQAELNAPVDCACVIHGDAYDWRYVQNLYNMLVRNLSRPVRLHVWTETKRAVPAPFIKHNLVEWPGITGPRKSWWYKLQMFDSQHHQGRLLYFDLDTVIVDNIDWMLQLDTTRHFWCIKDFRHFWKGNWAGINSSVMVWNTTKFDFVWKNFAEHNIQAVTKRFHGDQDFLSDAINQNVRRYLDPDMIKSWRWQIKDGGMDFKTREYARPGAGSVVYPPTAVMVFHGSPKPHEISDPVVAKHWC